MEPNDRGAASVDGRTQERLVEMEARYKSDLLLQATFQLALTVLAGTLGLYPM